MKTIITSITRGAHQPLQTELRFNVWIVSGSGAPETSLFAFVHQADGGCSQ
jgi:hypothetical protein